MDFLNITWIPLIIALFISTLVMRKSRKTPNLPPGPTPLPIIGNLHIISHLPHRGISNLAQKYGPIMTLYFGSLPTIVISSSQLAEKVLKTQDHIFASRPPMGDDNHFLNPQKVSLAPYGPYWKLMRKFIIQELLSPKRMKSFASLRAQEVFSMICSVLQKAGGNRGVNPCAVDVTREVGFLTNNIICRMSFGKKCNEAELGGREFNDAVREVLGLSSGINYRDYIALLGWLDLQGSRRRQADLTKIFHEFVDKIVDEHIERRNKCSTGLECEDFVDMLLSLSEDESMEIKITRENIKNVLIDLLAAATDTAGATLEWAMSELLRNPSAMKRAQEELESVTGLNRMVEEYDLPHLHYLHSVVKETLRLYPPVPLLLPRQSMECSTIEGYQIPEKIQVLINAWAIARDPIAWEEADKFKSERFLGNKIDVKGQDFEGDTIWFRQERMPRNEFSSVHDPSGARTVDTLFQLESS
ncbi:hypothetical protein KI387_014550 [Taxus chinensis]|uniref:Cytochrome P450 n=1 Tax=Taxus chinensis TaxID=29808 RepID=A0AA38FI74_TAXCH|nr:hypothetical protein KI387_014550 [Taxus chinensis]